MAGVQEDAIVREMPERLPLLASTLRHAVSEDKVCCRLDARLPPIVTPLPCTVAKRCLRDRDAI